MNREPIDIPDGAPRKTGGLTVAVVALFAAAALCLTHVAAFLLGRRTAPADGRPAIGAACGLAPGNTAAKRNIVWQALNSEAQHWGEGAPPEKVLAEILRLNLVPRTDAEGLTLGRSLFACKSPFAFPDSFDELKRSNSPEERLGVLRSIVAAELEADSLLRGVLNDKERMELLISGKTIPLETVPGPR